MEQVPTEHSGPASFKVYRRIVGKLPDKQDLNVPHQGIRNVLSRCR